MDARYLTVGVAAENTWIARRDGSDRALLIDPGDEAARLEAAIEDLGVTIEAILITHCHFDHVGAVAEMARHTGAPVYCPAGEVFILENINDFVRFPGFGPFESYSPEETVKDGAKLALAGFEIDVIGTPGLPGSDHATLLRSIAKLLDTLPDETGVLPGHMGPTTLGEERATNPFLRELAPR